MRPIGSLNPPNAHRHEGHRSLVQNRCGTVKCSCPCSGMIRPPHPLTASVCVREMIAIHLQSRESRTLSSQENPHVLASASGEAMMLEERIATVNKSALFLCSRRVSRPLHCSSNIRKCEVKTDSQLSTHCHQNDPKFTYTAGLTTSSQMPQGPERWQNCKPEAIFFETSGHDKSPPSNTAYCCNSNLLWSKQLLCQATMTGGVEPPPLSLLVSKS